MTVEKLVEAQENLVNYIDRIIAHRDGYYGIDAGKHDAKYLVHMIVESALSTIAHDDATRRECADRAVEYCKQFEGFFEGEDDAGLRSSILGTEPARDSLPETKSTGGANTLAERISLLKIARDNKTGISLDWVETGIALRNLAKPAREES